MHLAGKYIYPYFVKEHPCAVHITRSPIREVGTHSKHSLIPTQLSAIVVWRSGRGLEMIYHVSDEEGREKVEVNLC